jgi:hypothetical protein
MASEDQDDEGADDDDELQLRPVPIACRTDPRVFRKTRRTTTRIMPPQKKNHRLGLDRKRAIHGRTGKHLVLLAI